MSRGKFDFEYSSFSNCWTGLAAMILLQAIRDLENLGCTESKAFYGKVVTRWEIVNFLRSPWAEFLGEYVGISRKEIDYYLRKAGCL